MQQRRGRRPEEQSAGRPERNLLAVILALGRLRSDPTRVAQRLVPEEPRAGGVVRHCASEEHGVGYNTRWVVVSVHRRDRADARVKLQRVVVALRGDHRKVEGRLDCGAGRGHVPGVEADVRAEACVGLRVCTGGVGSGAVVSRMSKEGLRRERTIIAARLYAR